MSLNAEWENFVQVTSGRQLSLREKNKELQAALDGACSQISEQERVMQNILRMVKVRDHINPEYVLKNIESYLEVQGVKGAE